MSKSPYFAYFASLTFVLLFFFGCVLDVEDGVSVIPQGSISDSSKSVPKGNVYVVPYGSQATILFSDGVDDDSSKLRLSDGGGYSWYESSDGSVNSWSLIEGENCSSFVTPTFTEKKVRYYYGNYTVESSDSDSSAGSNSGSNSSSDSDSALETSDFSINSNVFLVACTGLPVLQIDTVDSEEPSCDYVYTPPANCYGSGLRNATKVPSRARLYKYGQQSAIYDSGDYVKNESGLTIKMRGNTSAYGLKRPYKLKLQQEADLLSEICVSSSASRSDSSYKDTEWLLLTGATNLNTVVGLSVADIAGTPWTPEFAFVNVVINGDYRGIYMLIESISKSPKRVDVADDGYIIERDAYWWNEEVFFRTDLNQKFTFKYPNDETITSSQFYSIKNYVNLVEQQIKSCDYENYIDVQSFARWSLIHDLLGSWDSCGSNIYISKYDDTSPSHPSANGSWSKLTMSTPWDFDSNYMMKDAWSNVHVGGRIYLNLLFSNSNRAFVNSYKTQYQALKSTLWPNLQEKLVELQTSIGDDVNLSRNCDGYRWGVGHGSVQNNINVASDWFTSRLQWLDTEIGAL